MKDLDLGFNYKHLNEGLSIKAQGCRHMKKESRIIKNSEMFGQLCRKNKNKKSRADFRMIMVKGHPFEIGRQTFTLSTSQEFTAACNYETFKHKNIFSSHAHEKQIAQN